MFNKIASKQLSVMFEVSKWRLNVEFFIGQQLNLTQ